MATHHETAEKCAEKVFQVIERNGRINKTDIVEAIESVLALQVAPAPSTVGGGGAGSVYSYSCAPPFMGGGAGGLGQLPTFASDAIDRMRITSLLQQHLANHPGAILSCGNE